VNTFAEDSQGNLWIGTNGGGLFYFDRQKNIFKSYKHNPSDNNSLSIYVVVDVVG
jgi:ligand-binding sensor domain-containing protein